LHELGYFSCGAQLTRAHDFGCNSQEASDLARLATLDQGHAEDVPVFIREAHEGAVHEPKPFGVLELFNHAFYRYLVGKRFERRTPVFGAQPVVDEVSRRTVKKSKQLIRVL
jgi:hypothetical protein